LARGKSRNDSIEKTIQVAREVAITDVHEVVLTGVNIGDFGQGSDENFFELIKQLDEIEGIERFRISSIEPNLLTNEIISFVSTSKKFMPHFHLPLQSGSNKILELMRRKYLKELYVDRVTQIKQLMPHACIGVDVIVGFPGETEEDFLETYQFLNELPVSYLHVFTYSERQNTTANKMSEVVPKEERSKRSKMLHILSEKKRRQFYSEHIGATYNVLFESENHEGFLNGFTENYIKVKVPYNEAFENTIQSLKLSNVDADGIVNVTTPKSRDKLCKLANPEKSGQVV
jgi:threonylcarbamoyladenosine tRNA methylthiotransferase MtaB